MITVSIDVEGKSFVQVVLAGLLKVGPFGENTLPRGPPPLLLTVPEEPMRLCEEVKYW